jgi:hypothetical protein
VNNSHNIDNPGEIVRVLKPGGRVVRADIRHHDEYAQHRTKAGLAGGRRTGPAWRVPLRAALTMGQLRPDTVVGRKPAQ